MESRSPSGTPDMRSKRHDDEEPLVRAAIDRVLDGEVDAFAVVVRTFRNLVAADLARRLPAQDVQDVAQDAFVRAYRALPAFRGEAPVRVWLLRIARRAAMDFWRRRYRRRDRLLDDLDDAARAHIEARRQDQIALERADREAEDNARRRVEAALLRLSPNDRAVITLVDLEDRSMQEAAEVLHCGLSAVKVRAFRARRRLRLLLESDSMNKEHET